MIEAGVRVRTYLGTVFTVTSVSRYPFAKNVFQVYGCDGAGKLTWSWLEDVELI